MVVIPAIDILDGRCVRLSQGDYARPTVYSEDPGQVAATFTSAGARRLHVVDLDGARGSAANAKAVAAILGRRSVDVQVAGGVRSTDRVDALIEAGATAVVMGTAAVENAELFELCARRHPGRVMAALDLRGGKPAVSGWQEAAVATLDELLRRWDVLPLAGVILTCIERDGMLSGPDVETLVRVRRMTGHQLQYSGGVSSHEDIRAAAAAGAQAVIIGKALYEGRLTLADALAT